MQPKPPSLGSPFVVTHHLLRRTSNSDAGRFKSWERVELSEPLSAIFVGRRMKSNGKADCDFEFGYEYKPVAFFEVWLFAYRSDRDFLVVLPSDATGVKDEKHGSHL